LKISLTLTNKSPKLVEQELHQIASRLRDSTHNSTHHLPRFSITIRLWPFSKTPICLPCALFNHHSITSWTLLKDFIDRAFRECERIGDFEQIIDVWLPCFAFAFLVGVLFGDEVGSGKN
jgi:hypothetical protein